MRLGKIIGTVFLLALVSASVGACSGSDSAEGGGTSGDGGADQSFERSAPEAGAGGGSMGRASDGDPSEGFESADTATGSNSYGGTRAATLPSLGPSVIKTGTMELEVGEGDFRSAIEEGIAVAERHGGFVLSTSTHDDRRGRGSVVLRIPAERFEAAMNDLHDLGKVTGETISGEDVGQEFVDLQARLRNYSAQEAILLDLMNDAVSVSDTIRVQSELQGVQLEIERLRGRIRYLEDQTSLGTIEMRVTEAGVAPEPAGTIERAFARARAAFMDVVATVIVGAGFVVPVTLIAIVVLLVLARLRPRFDA